MSRNLGNWAAGHLGVAEWLTPLAELRRVFVQKDYFPPSYRSIAGLPTAQGIFRPFMSSDDVAESALWRRTGEVTRFTQLLTRSSHKHIIVTGKSGVGKSVFLRHLVKDEYGGRIIFINRYDRFLHEVLEAVSKGGNIPATLEDDIMEWKNNGVSLSIERTLRDPQAIIEDRSKMPGRLVGSLCNFLTDSLDSDGQVLLVFDQIERFFAKISNPYVRRLDEMAGKELVLLIIALRHLRAMPQTRTVFVLRQDNIHESVNFVMNSCWRSENVESIVEYFYMGGITNESMDAVSIIQKDVSRAQLPVSYGELARFAQIDSRAGANAFILQLSGYLLEHIGEKNKKLIEAIKDKTGSDELLRIFFEHLTAHFASTPQESVQNTQTSYEIFKLVLATIAIENRRAARAVSIYRIARLAHIPTSDTKIVVERLAGLGVLSTDRMLDERSDRTYRFVHDILCDFVLDGEPLAISPRHEKAIERLSDRNIQSDKLVGLESFGRIVENWREPAALAVLTYFLLGGLVAVFGLASLLTNTSLSTYSWICWLTSRPAAGVTAALPVLTPLYASCSVTSTTYPPTYFMHAVWVWYIYDLERGYLRYALQSSRRFQLLASSLPFAGVFFGILSIHFPPLHVFPITIVGFLLTSVIWRIAMQSSSRYLAQENRRWSLRTGLNMVFVCFLGLVHYFFFAWAEGIGGAHLPVLEGLWSIEPLSSADAGRVTQFLGFCFVMLLLVWFWGHIWSEQQREIALSERLADYDRATLVKG